MSKSIVESIMEGLAEFQPEYDADPFGDNKVSDPVVTRMVSVDSPMSGAIQVTWEEVNGKSIRKNEPFLEIAYRQWDRTHGLSQEHVEAIVQTPDIAVVVVKAILKVDEDSANYIESLMSEGE